uniref:Uncharacterized protein n=1 Tax=Arundo donax TaxID=35708 RepID=A0A0A8Y986_ARUDO
MAFPWTRGDFPITKLLPFEQPHELSETEVILLAYLLSSHENLVHLNV